ncbi:hypothetical protein PC128_g11190 [Phytophthora cactorum]|nr:hypothetical protein PC128_g11190 [Phytophthora cactorum]
MAMVTRPSGDWDVGSYTNWANVNPAMYPKDGGAANAT